MERDMPRCDLCGDVIEPDTPAIFETDGEIAHKACVRDWFRRNFGREALR